MTNGQKLLTEYVQTSSETAFRELVTRYLDLVYSTALRLVEGDKHRAEDVAQTVFVDLARKARTLSNDVMPGGWLHRHTCFVAANTMRSERRRQSRERQAVEMNALQENSGADYSLIAPILDDAINQLGEADRTAILLRFFEQRDFRSVGEVLGSNEDAARMRVTRALEKLHSLLKCRGVTTSAAALTIALSANAVQAAPAGLDVTISAAAALAGTAVQTSTVIAAAKTIAMTTLQKTIIGTALAATVGTGVYEAHQASTLRDQILTLQQQQTSLTTQLQQLTQEQEATKQQFAALNDNLKPTIRSNTAPAASSAPLSSLTLEAEIESAHAETSPGRREAALNRIGKSILPSDIPRAMAFLAKRPDMSGVQSPLFIDLASQWGSKDPDAATAWAANLQDDSARKSALVSILYGWTHVSPEAAANYAAALPPGDLQDAAVIKVVKEWSFAQPEAAANWVSLFPPGKLRDQAVDPVVFWGQGQCPAAVAEMLDTIGNTDLIQKYGETLASIWLTRDKAAARAWIVRSPLSDEIKQRLLNHED